MYILELSRGVPTEKYTLNGIFEFNQAKALHNGGNKIIFCALDMRSFRRKRKMGMQNFSKDGIDVYNCNFPLGALPNGIVSFFSWLCFKRAFKKIVKSHGKPEIIHAHFGRFTGRIAYKIKKKYNINYVITEHDSLIHKDLISNSERKHLQSIYNNSLKNIAVSKTFKKTLENIYKTDFNYIPNVVDVDFFNKQFIPHEKFTFLSIGNLIKGKGMDITISAFAKLHKKHINTTLMIAGEGSERENLEKLCKNLEIENDVVFLGKLNQLEVSDNLVKSDSFVLSSKSETFGVVYVEAMSAGLPVIATKCGGPESFINDKVGILVEKDNIEEVYLAMEKVLLNHSQFNSIEIKEFARNNFSPEEFTKKFINLLRGQNAN